VAQHLGARRLLVREEQRKEGKGREGKGREGKRRAEEKDFSSLAPCHGGGDSDGAFSAMPVCRHSLPPG